MNVFPNENALIGGSIAGQRNAFREIVAKYQSLVCSVAYSVTGDLARSEDLAQETFLVAWQKLGTLQDRSKLGPWLCGIVKNIARDTHRRGKRDLMHDATPLDEAVAAANVPNLADKITQSERERVMWAALEEIPETYREPLILFYRQGESVRGVAAALDLSEDAAKQRLSRGRKMLKAQVAAFVEKSLADSGPGKAFTIAVIATLPALAASSSAAAATAGAAATGAAVAGKGVAKTVLLTALLGGVAFMTLGLFNLWLMVRSAPNADARRKLIKNSARFIGVLWAYIGVLSVGYMVSSGGQTTSLAAIGLSSALLVAAVIAVTARSKRAAATDGGPVPFFAWTSAITIAGSLALVLLSRGWSLPLLLVSHGVVSLIAVRGWRMEDCEDGSTSTQLNYSPKWAMVISVGMFLAAIPWLLDFRTLITEREYVWAILFVPLILFLALCVLGPIGTALVQMKTRNE